MKLEILLISLIFLFFLVSVKSDTKTVYVTPYQTCGKSCTGDLIKPYDNILYALKSANMTKTNLLVILLGNSSAEHYILRRELSKPGSTSLLYDLTSKVKLTLEELEIRPLFCDEDIIKSNSSLRDKCVDRNQSITLIFKPVELTITINKKVSIQNIIFDWTESSQSVNSSMACSKNRTRCCNTNKFSGGIDCNLRFYTIQPPSKSNFWNLFELNSTSNNTKTLFFNLVTLKNFRDKTTKSFLETKGTFDLIFQNSIIEDVTFGRGLIGHVGDASLRSSLQFINITYTKYNYWNRDEDASLKTWKEGYLLYVDASFNASITIINSSFVDMNPVTMYTCTYTTAVASNKFRNFFDPKTDLWARYEIHSSIRGGSLVHIQQLDGDLTIKGSVFEKIIGLFGSIIEVQDTTDNTSFTFEDSEFNDNFGMQGFANIIVATNPRPNTEPVKCPSARIENCEFTNSKGCPASYGNVGFICYWDTIPSNNSFLYNSSSVYLAYQMNKNSLFEVPQIKVSNSKFKNNLIPLSNSLAIIGSFFTSVNDNIFQDNGGTTAELILYSFDNSNFLEKKPNQYSIDQRDWKTYFSSSFFGQSTALYVDRIFKFESIRNIFQRNWSPWEGAQALGTAVTVKGLIPFRSAYLEFQDNIFRDHWGIPPDAAEYLTYYGVSLKNNSYMQPLIAVSFDPKDASNFYEGANESHIVFDGVEFINNTLSFNLREGCKYNSIEIERICFQMKNKNRYLTGLVKFISEAELQEQSSVGYLTVSQQFEMSFSMINSRIINNTLLTQGCLFSTLWVENYLLYNLTIQGNKVNPTVSPFLESDRYSEPFLDIPLEKRDGIFCGSKKETINGVRNGILFTAANLKVSDNLGTIFNLYPSESNNFNILDSIFINNSDVDDSMVNIFETSNVSSINNVFIGNDNPLGIFFLNTLDASHTSISNTYLRNNGKHACLSYVNDKSQIIEVKPKSYWNSITPKFLTFDDEATPQGGLYFLESADVNFILSDFNQNSVYAGLIISQKSTVSFDIANISDHYITGNSVIGNFYSSILNMRQVNIVNNSLSYLPSFDSALAMILFDKGNINAEKIEIRETLSPNQGSFLIGFKIEGIIKDVKFEKIHTSNGAPLIRLDFSIMRVENLVLNDITSFLKLSNSELTLRNAFVQNLKLSSGSRFLVNLMDTNLYITQFKYFGGSESGDYFALITGTNNNVRMIEAEFFNAVRGLSKIFELIESNSIFVANSKFHYNGNHTQTLIFEIASTNKMYIKDCIFIFAGQVIQANSILTDLYFIGNVILTNSLQQNIEIADSNTTYYIDNHFLRQETGEVKTFPESQVNLLNSFGFTSIKHNSFFSLYGLRGIIKVQSFNNPYYLNTSQNVFIDNTGSNGGAFHLDASLSSLSYETPKANIKNSIFILNQAMTVEELKGKGGAIFQTTSTSTSQLTRIKNSFFIKNVAGSIGGAIFFDFLPLKVDLDSKFRENYANRLNHIGSYPVKLVYFTKEPEEIEPYLPNQRFLEQSMTSNGQDAFIKWENIPSGIQVNKTFIFGLIDMFDQIVYDDSSSTLELHPEGVTKDTKHFYSSILSLTAKNGLYTLSNFEFSHQVDELFNVSFTSSAIQNQREIPLDIPITSVSSLKVQIYFRKCGRGEIMIKKDEDTTICEECQPGLWQTSPISNALACKPCFDKSTICLKGDNVGPKKGYWRLNESADIVFPCPVDSSCLGNEITDQKEGTLLDPTGKCEYGYTGNLCSNCIPGWAKTSAGSCTDCQMNAWFYIRAALTLIAQFAFIIYGFRETMNLCKDYSKDKTDKLSGAILIRILTNYFQLISLVSGIPVTWPSLIRNISQLTSEVASINKNMFTVNCILNAGELFGIKIVYIKLLLEITGGLVLAFLSIPFWIIYFLFKKKKIAGNKRFTNNVIATMIVICFMMQPSAIQASLSFFQCTNLYREDIPVRYFSKDYDVKCWEGDHLYWTLGLGIPSLFIWAFILPFMVFNQIRKNKDNLIVQEISQKYSFLYGGYTRSKYYWELVIMIRKLVFICAIIGASFQSIDLEIFMSILLISLFFLIHSISCPFSDPKLNFLEKLSLFSAITINFCGLYFQFFSAAPVALEFIFIGIGLIANLGFYLAFLKFYLSIQIIKLKENQKVYKIFIKLIEKLGCGKYFKNLNSAKVSKEPTAQTELETIHHTQETNTFTLKTETELLKDNYSPSRKQTSQGHQGHQGHQDCSVFNDVSSHKEQDANHEIKTQEENEMPPELEIIEPPKNIFSTLKKFFSNPPPREIHDSFSEFDNLSTNQEKYALRRLPGLKNLETISNNIKPETISSTNTI